MFTAMRDLEGRGWGRRGPDTPPPPPENEKKTIFT